MTEFSSTIGRTARRASIRVAPLSVVGTGTAAASGGVEYGVGVMGGGSWGLFGGVMGLWGLLWMTILVGVPLYLAYSLINRDAGGTDEPPLSVLRERYARGELSDEEFESRRETLERSNNY